MTEYTSVERPYDWADVKLTRYGWEILLDYIDSYTHLEDPRGRAKVKVMTDAIRLQLEDNDA